MFKHILVPTDGSQHSQDTVRRVVTFAREAGARITAFHAKPAYRAVFIGAGALADSTTPEQFMSPERFDESTELEAQAILGFVETACQEVGVPCDKKTLTNDKPYLAIIQAATECGCDLIFMASHGHGGISALLLGSETNKVLTHTKIPVLVYRSA